MTAAAGLYTSASDLARFLRFQLNDGSIDGQTILEPAMIREQRTVPAPEFGCAKGVRARRRQKRLARKRHADLFSHGGAAYGFLAFLYWFPPLHLGIAVLTSSADHDLHDELARSILSDLIRRPGSVYQARLDALPAQSPVVEPNWEFGPPGDLTQRIAGLAMKPSGDEAARWAGYSANIYAIRVWGVIDPLAPPDRFYVESGTPYFRATGRRYPLTEIEPGLFLAWNGETLDLRTQPPTWRNLELVRLTGGPAPWQWVLLALTASVALWWLDAAWWLRVAIGSTNRPRRHRHEADEQAGAHPRWRLLTSVAATFTATLALATIAALVFAPRVVDSGFLGWLDLPLAVRLILHLPLALAIASGSLAALTILGWVRWRWTPAGQLGYAALVASSVALTAQLAVWNLIGWGLT